MRVSVSLSGMGIACLATSSSSSVLSGWVTSSYDSSHYFVRWYHENPDRDDCLDGRFCRRAPRFAKILRRYDRIGARWLQSRRSEIHGASRLSYWCAARFSCLCSYDIFAFFTRNLISRRERSISRSFCTCHLSSNVFLIFISSVSLRFLAVPSVSLLHFRFFLPTIRKRNVDDTYSCTSLRWFIRRNQARKTGAISSSILYQCAKMISNFTRLSGLYPWHFSSMLLRHCDTSGTSTLLP